MSSSMIFALLGVVLVLPFVLLLVGVVVYRKIKKDQEVKSQIPLPAQTSETDAESRALAERLRRENLRKD